MKANFFHSDLNPCGGGERLTLVTMQAVLEMGIDIDLTTLVNPCITKIENAFGKELAGVFEKIKKIHFLNHILDKESISQIINNGYDITINTHGDIDPFYDTSFSKNNAITYCHYPTAKQLIEGEDDDYIDKHLRFANKSALPSGLINVNTTIKEQQEPVQLTVSFDKKRYFEHLTDAYDKMMLNTTIVTNSEYSKKAIYDAYDINDVIILYPPVDVEKFRNALLSPSSKTDCKEDYIMIIARIEPSKKLENAIILAKMLKDKKIGKGMIIVGNLEPFYKEYSNQIKKMINDFELGDYIQLEIDASLEKLLSLLKKSKIFFHPRSGEHFGMSIVEAMSAGLIPVVADEGGQTEFVPLKYQYHTIEQASKIITSALNLPYSERILISDSVIKFSISNYKKNFKKIVNKVLAKKSVNNEIETNKIETEYITKKENRYQ